MKRLRRAFLALIPAGMLNSLLAAPSNKTRQREVLLVFGSPTCAPCAAFKGALKTDSEFYSAVSEEFIPLFLDVEDPQNSAAIDALAIQVVPTFVVPGKGLRFCGYAGPSQFLADLRSAKGE